MMLLRGVSSSEPSMKSIIREDGISASEDLC